MCLETQLIAIGVGGWGVEGEVWGCRGELTWAVVEGMEPSQLLALTLPFVRPGSEGPGRDGDGRLPVGRACFQGHFIPVKCGEAVHPGHNPAGSEAESRHGSARPEESPFRSCVVWFLELGHQRDLGTGLQGG